MTDIHTQILELHDYRGFEHIKFSVDYRPDDVPEHTPPGDPEILTVWIMEINEAPVNPDTCRGPTRIQIENDILFDLVTGELPNLLKQLRSVD